LFWNSQNYAAGSALQVLVQTAASGCTTNPADANVVVQYRMQQRSQRSRMVRREPTVILAVMHSSLDTGKSEEFPRWTRTLLFRIACVTWLVAAQVWYYWQFRALLRSAMAPVLSRLWRF
jgi:hypothetical protein